MLSSVPHTSSGDHYLKNLYTDLTSGGPLGHEDSALLWAVTTELANRSIKH